MKKILVDPKDIKKYAQTHALPPGSIIRVKDLDEMEKHIRPIEKTEPPLCIKCKWCKKSNIHLDSLTQYTYICRRPLKKSLVTGKMVLHNKACELERSEINNSCGESGIFFEQK